ncbi:flagellar hook capping FlgD N-terminal domain-containing protein [Sulfoacidibacillus ferrooxidans]|uniref:Flagellar hook capping protein n=1 Tax=Sulfoacidibacillus ferrooxidans TaxID=2005001 RepID=A0A9X2ACB6_9BACL|nr:flagellar hook capping FlgD N-terminal domain-containing protein [Sulfoacidibacillus ferrooxidans]MCI0183594.1 hypothetical protein [Sulfoacidibacillus ferrooxidans]
MSMTPASLMGTSSTNAATTATDGTTQTTTDNSQLGQNAFLQLLVTQMKYQDPLSPQSNTQFIAQLAQFSSLEQMTNVAQGQKNVISDLQSLQTSQSMTSALQLLGATVSLTDGSGASVNGSVSSVQSSANGPTIMVDGTTYPLSAVQSVIR